MNNEISINKTVGINREVGFLYKKCKKIKPSVISAMALVPEFIEVIKAYEGSIDDETVYELLREKSKEMYNRGKGGLYRTARDVMKKVSRDVKGDTLVWERECEEEASETENATETAPVLQCNPDIRFLFESCTKIKPSVICQISSIPEYVEAIKSYEGYIDDEAVYEILRAEAKKLYARGIGGLYEAAKDVMRKVSRDVKGDRLAWRG